MKHSATVALAAALTWTATAAAAAGPPTAELESRWDEELAKIEERLADGRWRAGTRLAGELRQQVTGREGAFFLSSRPLARAVALLAIGEAGLGRREDAAWHWTLARNLDPGLRPRIDLERFGAAGRFLLEVPLRRRGEIPEDLGGGDTPLWAELVEIDTGLGAWCGKLQSTRDYEPVAVDIELVLTPEGEVRAPRLLSRPDYPAYALQALECIRDRRYRPVLRGDVPTVALGNLRVNFNS